ncbi:MAG: hypothetical protein PHT80_09105 [Lentisphaeria bacterium]|nr:hypothetical protein [Lentisphaeria bacterium]
MLSIAVDCCRLLSIAVDCCRLPSIAVDCRRLPSIAVDCCRLLSIAVDCCRAQYLGAKSATYGGASKSPQSRSTSPLSPLRHSLASIASPWSNPWDHAS